MGLSFSSISEVANKNIKCDGTAFVLLDDKTYGPIKTKIKNTDVSKDRVTKLNLLIEFVQMLLKDKPYLGKFVKYIQSTKVQKYAKQNMTTICLNLLGCT